MSEALEKVDLKGVEALKKLKDEQDVLRKRLKSMDDMKEKVDPKVYARVSGDYRKRLDELDAEAAPLRDQVRAEYAKLKSILDDLEAQHETVRLDREEVELRHTLGEFDEKEYQRRLGELDAAIKTGASSKKKAEELKKRFLGSVDSEADLESAAAAPKPAAAAAGANDTEPGTQQIRAVPAGAVAATQEMPILDEDKAKAAPGRTEAATPPPPPKGPTPAPKAPAFNPDATITIKSARLVPQNAEAGRNPVSLGLKPSSIGSDESCDIRIGGDAVSPTHAKITISMSGYTLVDLGSKTGTVVNGDKIRDRVLRDGDAVQIGPARFIFREA